MKKIAIAALSASLLSALPMGAQTYGGSDPVGTVSYALPSTVITLQVEAVKESFYAGPYARFAKKYLGIDAKSENSVSVQVSEVKMIPSVEADQTRRFQITPGKGSISFLSLTTQGLISTGDGSSESTIWRFPAATKDNFSEKGVTSNLTSESATLYRNLKSETSYNQVAVQQSMVVQKSLDARAKEAADMIFNLRKKRVQIVTGDTDAEFSGEALGAAIAEINSLEKEYMSMFIGYSEYQKQQMNYDIVPSPDNSKQIYVAFRVSDAAGLVPADDVSGKPYVLEIVPQEISASGKNSPVTVKGNVAVYRIPAICNVKLSDGASVLLQSRMPVYQLGIESTFPISVK